MGKFAFDEELRIRRKFDGEWEFDTNGFSE